MWLIVARFYTPYGLLQSLSKGLANWTWRIPAISGQRQLFCSEVQRKLANLSAFDNIQFMLIICFINEWHVIEVCLLSQSAPKKHNQEKKSPHTFAHLTNFSKMCRPCLIIIQSCYFYNRINKAFTCSYSVICTRDLDVLRAQRIIGFKKNLNYP